MEQHNIFIDKNRYALGYHRALYMVQPSVIVIWIVITFAVLCADHNDSSDPCEYGDIVVVKIMDTIIYSLEDDHIFTTLISYVAQSNNIYCLKQMYQHIDDIINQAITDVLGVTLSTHGLAVIAAYYMYTQFATYQNWSLETMRLYQKIAFISALITYLGIRKCLSFLDINPIILKRLQFLKKIMEARLDYLDQDQNQSVLSRNLLK